MKRVSIVISLWLILFSSLYSQTFKPFSDLKSINQSTLFGIGKVALHDSYLSPLNYEGVAISLLHERMKGSQYFNGDLVFQNQFRIQTGITENPTSTASEYWGSLYYNLNGFYPLITQNDFRLFGGAGLEATLGGIYNVRNSNNPGSLKTSANLTLSAMALYNWRFLTLRWQITSPCAGMFFSPGYGHSYYEIFTLGNNKGTLHFGSFNNQLAMRNYFTVDIPVSSITLRAGYMWDYYHTNVNQLKTRINSHQFLIGLAFESLNFGGKKTLNPILNSVYY